jgi:hypothetical protein
MKHCPECNEISDPVDGGFECPGCGLLWELCPRDPGYEHVPSRVCKRCLDEVPPSKGAFSFPRDRVKINFRGRKF